MKLLSVAQLSTKFSFSKWYSIFSALVTGYISIVIKFYINILVVILFNP